MVSVSKDLILGVSRLLNDLEIKNFINVLEKNKSNEKTAYRIFINGKPSLEQWSTQIGFSNPSQETKYLTFKKFGFVPPKTTLNLRKSFLKGDKNPMDCYSKI